MGTPHIARCNTCKPVQHKEFGSEKKAKEWGREHELNEKIMGNEGHVVRYAMKAGA